MWRGIAGMRSAGLALCLGGGLLGGCSLAGAIGQNSVDYNDTMEYVTNNMLVTNVLRARDQVPLHFTDLALIHGVIQAGVSVQAQAPFGNPNIANQKTRDIFTGIVSAGSNPTFDVAPLNTTKFATALLAPLDVSVLQNYAELGIAPKLLMMLLVARIDFVRTQPGLVICGFANTPVTYVGPAAANAACPPSSIQPPPHDFSDLIEHMTLPPIIHTFQHLRPFGPAFVPSGPNEIRDLGVAGASTLLLRPVRGHPGQFQFFKPTSQTVICLPLLAGQGTDGAPGYVPSAGCYETMVEGEDPPRAMRVQITMRSVMGIFEFLGGVLAQRERSEQLVAAGRAALPEVKNLGFFVSPGEVLGARLNLTYNGALYHVDEPKYPDNTMRMLQIVNQLVDTLKSATEIPTTRAVDVLP